MKRFFLACLTLFALLIPLMAQAEWVTKEIQWRISGMGPLGTSTSIWVRDTLKTAVGTVDTTAGFTLDDATVPPRGSGGAGGGLSATGGGNSTDTTVVAWIVIQQDTAAAFTPTITNLTMLVDGRIGGFGPTATLGEGWVKADSAFINGAAGGHFATGNQTVGLPIKTISPYGNVLRWGELRGRITGATGELAGARVFLRYYRPDMRSYP